MATNADHQRAWRERRDALAEEAKQKQVEQHAENINLRAEVAYLRAEVHRLEAALAAASRDKAVTPAPAPAQGEPIPKRPTLAEKKKRFRELQEQQAQQARQAQQEQK